MQSYHLHQVSILVLVLSMLWNNMKSALNGTDICNFKKYAQVMITDIVWCFFGGESQERRVGASPTLLCAHYLKSFSTIFHSNLNVCFVHTFPMELEYTKTWISSDAFSYIVSTHFLYAEYEDSCLITRWKFKLLKDYTILVPSTISVTFKVDIHNRPVKCESSIQKQLQRGVLWKWYF